MREATRDITSGREFEAALFPKRARARAQAARHEAEVRARELGETLAHEHLRGIAGSTATHQDRRTRS
jgi:hypothetical protein